MSSAEPDAMIAFADALSAMVDELSPRLQQMGAETLAYQLKPHPGGPDLSDYAYGTDPATIDAARLAAFADRVRQVGLAFRYSSDFSFGPTPERTGPIQAPDAEIDAAIQRLNAPPVYRDQPPLAERLVTDAGEFAPYPAGQAMAGGYHHGGAIVGPDGHTYPLAVPYLADDGVVYTADAEPGRDGIGVLDGADRGWQVVGTELGTSPLPGAEVDSAPAPYTVTYEQHPDGRLRAQLTFPSPAAGAANADGGSIPAVAVHAVYAGGALLPIAMRIRSRRKVRS